MTTPRQHKAEQAVLDYLREPGCRGIVSLFWISDNRIRAAAWERLWKSGRITVAVLAYPHYRVTIARKKTKETTNAEHHARPERT